MPPVSPATLTWIREEPPVWDDDKERIVGGTPDGTFEGLDFEAGALVPGDWWRVEQNGKVVGYGWMDTSWGGDAQILLAVAPEARGRGIGTWILDRLEDEARARDLCYIFNTIPPRHPDPEGLAAWLKERGFVPSPHDRLLRRRVAPPPAA
ncbi:MAG: N-acetyltransferase [Deltaproteobacteria bacterium]|nr:MAG: N-acetyltransferase [Deltaproteobacteria bacterium]